MKLKQFIFALVAMLSSFAFTANAQVAKVGTTEYATIDEALNNWKAGTTLTLLDDVQLSGVVKINSNESRTLDLGTFTMKAAKNQDAFQYVVKGCTSDVGLSITADATNPGGIEAPGKAIIRHTKPIFNAPSKDRPYTQFFGGVFSASYIVYQGSNTGLTTGYTGASAPRFVFHGGEFNGTIYANRSKFTFNGGTFNGEINISVDSSADALVKGGKFKNLSNKFGSDLNDDKFTIGSAAGVYDRGIYVDKDGYYVITSAPITEVSAKYPAVKKESYNSNNYFYYSAAATYGMFYEVASMAGTGSNVTVWEKPAVTIPETLTGDAVEEIKNNTALKDYTPENLPAGAELEIVLESVGETIVYDVTPMNNGAEVEPTNAITFRLPVPASVIGNTAKVYHEDALMGIYEIKGEGNAKYIEISSADFSVYTVEPVKVVATYEELVAALANENAFVQLANDITATATQSSGYGKAGIVVEAGDILDGNDKTLTINGAGGTWDCVIAMKGGEVKNLTIAGAMRGIFMPGANGDVVIDNCEFKNVVYTFNSDAGSKDYTVTIKNTALNGWTSFSNAHKSVTFESCTFGEGSGYAYCRPYQATTFVECEFAEGYEFDTKSTSESLAFNECTYNGVALSADNNAMFYNGGSVVIDGVNTNVTSVAKIGDKKYASLAEAAAAAQAGDEIVMLADVTLDAATTLPAGITFNGNGKQINGTIIAAGDITFAGVTKAGDLDFAVGNTVVNIPAGASLQLNGSARMSIGFGTTFNIVGTIEDAKTADKATVVPSLVIPGASFSGAGVKFNVTNAYISVPSSYCSTSKTASGTFDFNITNSIWESAGKLAFEEQSVNAKVDFALVNSVLTTGSHLVFGTASGEEGVVIDNSYVNKDTSIQLENCGTMTVKNGSVVNGAVATSSNAKNPGTVIVENATYAVTGEFSGSDLGTGTIIIKKDANVSVGSIKAGANVTVDATGMTAGDVVNFTANLSQFTGTLSVINNDKLEAKIVDGKIVLAAKPVAKIGEQGYATLEAAFAAATEGQTIVMLDDATPALTSQRAITKAAVIDLGGKTLTLTEDDLYFGTTTFQNGTIVVDPSVKPSTAVFWMFANQTLTFDNVKVVATGVTGTYLIGLEGDNSDLNLLNGSEILVENTTALDLDIICVNGTNTCDIKVENSKVNVTNLDGRVFFRGNYTVKDSEVNLAGITKAGFRIEAGQTLSIEGTSKVNIEGEPRDGGIHMTDLTATYTKDETATVNATVNEPKVAKVGENTYRTLAQAVAAVEDGGTITLIANETFTKNNRYNNGGWWDGLGYSGDKSFTIDLGGFTVSQDGSLNDYLFWFKNAGSKANTITIKNGTLDAGTTAFCALCTASSHDNELTVNTEDVNLINNISNGSTVKIRAGSVYNAKAGTKITGKNSYLGIENWNATVNIYNGAEIYMNGTSSYNGCLVGVGGNGTVNVYGGYGKGVKGGFIAMTSGGTINVEGGEWIANTDGTVGNNSNLYVLTAQSNKYESGFAGPSIINVTGGTLRGGMDAWVLNNLEGEKAELNISGGNFNSNPSAYVKAGYVATEAAGIYTVVEAPAYIEGKASYVSLAAAYEAAVNGDVIVLNESVTSFPVINKAVTFKGGKENAAVEINYALSQNFTAIDGTVKFENLTFNKPLFTEHGGNKPGLSIEFEGCNFNVNSEAGYGILIGTSWSNSVVKGLKVNNCNFKYVGDAFKGGYMLYVQCVNEVTITNNTIDGNNLYRGAIHLGDATEHATVATVSNNTIKNFCRGVMMGNRVTGSSVAISGNTFDNINYSDKDSKPAQECAPIFIHSNATAAALQVALTNNVVENCANPMIYSEDTDLIKYYVTEFTGNTVNGSAVEFANSYNAPNQVFPVATINDVEYFTLQAAINAVKNGETIVLARDFAEDVTVTEKAGLYYTIDGNGKKMNGTITVSSLSDTNDNRRITIKNINFVDTVNGRDFITSVNTNHYPRLTVESCSFTGTGKEAANSVAIRLKSSHSVVIKNCTGTGLHSFLQNTSGWNLTIEGVTVTDSKSAFALGTVQGVTVKGCTADVDGYGIRMDAQYNNNAVLENNTVKAFIPVVVRKASVESNIAVNGTNTMTATNTDGIWFAAGTSEYENNGEMPTATTAKVLLVVNDTKLDIKKAYGNYVEPVAKVGDKGYGYIEDAIKAWTNGTTLTLLADVTLSDVIQLSSTEYHILDLGTYTMTAASKKDAIQIVNNGRTSASYALDIKANAENPGAIVATGKAVVKTTGKSGVKDRPIIRFYNGVFTGTNVVSHSGSNGTNCPQFWFYGGTFNGTVYANRALCQFYGGTFNGSLQISVDSSAYALISGGRFKHLSNLYGSALNSSKFTIGSAKGVYDREVYVDSEGYYVVAATEPAEGVEADVATKPNSNNYFAYSKVGVEGQMAYTNVETALKNNTSATVTVYVDEVDMSGINFKGAIVVPVGETVTITNAPATPAFTVKSADGYVIEPNENGAYESIALVAKIGDKVYDKFEDAVAAAQEGETVTVHKAGTYALKVKNNITITGAVAGVEFANIGAFGCNGANVTFNNVTFTYAENSTYKGLQHSGNLVYNNCTFNGQVFLYGQSETFNKCTFNTTDSNNYNVWTYGAKNVAFNECTFNSAGKSVLIYAESTSVTNNVTVTKSQFNASQAVEGKAAIEMDSSLSGAISLTIDAATTATGFAAGNVSGNSLWNNKKGNNDVANNDITVKVGDTVVLAPIFEAQIGDAQYRFFQDAINAVQNGETITVLRDIATNVEIKEKDNVKVTIDGNGMKMTGAIKVVALSSDNDRRITIKNFKFEDTTSASVDFITSVETNHYPRITVEGCTFTGSGDATDVALRLKSSKNVEIKNCTGTGLHSFLQNTSGWNLTVENVTVTESKSAFALGTVQGVTVKGCTADVDGYGIRMDAGYNNNAVIESNTIKAFIPVVVRKATVNSNIAVNGTNNLTATNSDGIWCAIGTSEYEANGSMPTAATGNVVVALNDADLDSKGIYGNALAGQGTAEAPYLINNIGELVLFRNSVNAGETKYNAPGVWVALNANIDLAGTTWAEGIGDGHNWSFDGNFDGKNHTIKNLTVAPVADANKYLCGGLFGYIYGNVTIKNLVIENATIATTAEGHNVGVLVGFANNNGGKANISNITVKGDIKVDAANAYGVGAIVGYSYRDMGTITNCTVEANDGSYIKGYSFVGGITGYSYTGATIANCSVKNIDITATKYSVAGIVGLASANNTVSNCAVENVTVNGEANVGNVIGAIAANGIVVENCAAAEPLVGGNYSDNKAVEARIGNKYYATLDAALAAEGEATVELFVPVTVATGESRVIELNGKTVIGTDNATGSFALININPEAELTINGEGAIKLTATNNRGWNAYSSVISNQRGKLTVNGGTIEHLGGTDMAYAIDNLTNTGAQNAETVINGGTVKSTYRAIRQFLNSTSAQNVLTVNGGTIEGANKSIWMQGANANANPGALTVAAAAAIKGDVYLTTAAGTAEYPVVVAVAADALKDGAQVLTSNVPADFAVANVNGTWTKVDAAASLNGKGYATLRAAVEAAQNGETVELLANVTLAGGYEDATEGLRIEREITLNGNGHTIDCGTFQKGIRIYNLGTDGDFQVNFNNVEVVNNVANGRCIDTRSHDINLTIIDSKLIAQNGNSQPLTIGGSEAIQRVKLDDAIIDAGNSGYGVIAFVPVKQNIYAYDNTKVTGYAAFYLKDYGNANIKLSLGKGTYIGKNIHSGASNAFGTVVLEGDNNVLQILGTNPILKAITEGNASQAVVLVIGANNKVSLESESATIDIEGENAYYGMISAENAGTTTIINKGNTMFPVAEVGGFQFMTIKEAIRYAGNEGTVKAINDCVLKESWTVTAGQNITFDLNGKTVSYTSAVAGEDMITNRGNLTITDSSDAKTGKLAYVNTDNTASNVTVSTISTEAGSTLVVDGGTIENKTVKADGSSIYSYAIDILTNGNLGDVNVTINGGTVYSDYMAIRQFNNGTACKNSLTINGGYIYGAKRAVQVHMDNNAAVTAIKGGKVEAGEGGYAICNFAATSDLAVTGGEFIGAVYSARENFISGGIYDAEVYAGYCAEGYMPNKNVDGTYGVVLVANAYASIDGVTYGSLKAAVAAAKAGDTITLLQDINEGIITIEKSLTIDGNNKTFTGHIHANLSNVKMTVKNVNFNGDNATYDYAIRVDRANHFTAENCTADGYKYSFLYANKSNNNFTIKDVTVTNCANYGVYFASFNNATIENLTVIGAEFGVAAGNAANSKVNIKNCTFDVELPLYIQDKGTGKVTFTFEGVNNMGDEIVYLSEYVKLASAAQVGTTVYGNFAEAFAAAQDGETVKLLSDFNLGLNDAVVNNAGQKVLANVDGKNITFDMNGKKITVDHRSTEAAERIFSVICVEDGAGLTVKGNGSIDVTTGVTDANVMPKVAYMFWKRGTTGYLVIEDGNYHMDNSEDSMVYTNGGNIVTVKGGTFILDAVGTRTNGFPWVFNVAGNDVASVNVTGGTYNYDIRKQFWAQEVKLAEGLTMTNNADGTWTVVPAVASIVGGESYGSIQEAIDAAQDGETVKLLADVAYADADALSVEEKPYSTMLYVQGKNITLDLNGKNIDVEYTGSLLYSVVLVSDGAGLTVTGEGSINVRGLKADGTAAKNIAYVFWKRGTTGYLVIENGTFRMNDAADSMVYTNGDEIVTVNGGTFILDAVASQANGWPVIFNTAGNNEQQIVVNGGTFNYNINYQMRPFEVYIAPQKALKKVQVDGVDMWTIVAAQAYVTEKLGDFVTDENGSYEHNVGYETIAEAFAAVKNGETVTILAGEYTQNLNVNKAITVKGEVDAEGNNLVTFNGKLSITADGATVENLNFNNSGTAAYVGAKNVTIDGCSLVGSNGLYQSYTSGTVTFKNSYIKGGTYGIHFDGNAGGNIVIENCTVIGWTSFAGTINSVAISGTTFAEGNYNQLRLYQNATISDCTFNEKMNIDWGSSNKTAEFTNCSVEGDKDLTEIISLANIATKGLEVTIDGERVCVAAKVDSKYYLSLQEAINAATEGQTVTIVSDLALTEGVTVAADKNIFIDLNGKTITGTPAEAKAYAVITNKGTLTIEGEGAIVCDHTLAGSTSYAVNTITNSGSLTIDGATIENKSTANNQIGYAIDNNSTTANATVTVNGGKVTASGSLYYDGIRQFCNSTTAENNVYVVGGEVSTIWMQNPSDGTTKNTKDVNGYVAISGGTVGVLSLEPSANFDAAVTGGHVGEVSYFQTAEGRNLKEFVTGGTFGTLIAEDPFLAYGYQVTNDAAPYKVEWTGRREVVTINDNGSVVEFANETDITVGTLTYKRNFGTAKNQSFYVPFEVPMSKIKDDFNVYYISNMHAYDKNEDAVADSLVLEAFKLPANAVLKANYPYIIRAKVANTEMNIELSEATLREAEENSIECSSVFLKFEIQGVYSRRVGPEYEGTYLLSGGTWKTMQADTNLNAFRLGMTITETGDSPYIIPAEAMRSIGIRVIGEENEDGTTTIYDINAENGEEMIFDLSGRRVLETEKGIYIKDGKKVLVK